MTRLSKHVPLSLPVKRGTAIVHGDPNMSDETRAALTRLADAAGEAIDHGDFAFESSPGPTPVPFPQGDSLASEAELENSSSVPRLDAPRVGLGEIDSRGAR